MPSLKKMLCYSSLGTAVQPPPGHKAELHCHHSSITAACGSPSSTRETAPGPGLQGFCRRPQQTKLLLPRKPSTFWRRRLQKHFNTAYANIANEPLASFPLQAAPAQTGKLCSSCSTSHTSAIVPTLDGVVPQQQRAGSRETATFVLP